MGKIILSIYKGDIYGDNLPASPGQICPKCVTLKLDIKGLPRNFKGVS